MIAKIGKTILIIPSKFESWELVGREGGVFGPDEGVVGFMSFYITIGFG